MYRFWLDFVEEKKQNKTKNQTHNQTEGFQETYFQ